MDFWSLLSPIYGGVVSLILGIVIGQFKNYRKETKAERQALGALLRNDMYAIYRKYVDQPGVPADAQEEMDSLYQAYHGLGFNNLGTKIHDEIMAKPTKV